METDTSTLAGRSLVWSRRRVTAAHDANESRTQLLNNATIGRESMVPGDGIGGRVPHGEDSSTIGDLVLISLPVCLALCLAICCTIRLLTVKKSAIDGTSSLVPGLNRRQRCAGQLRRLRSHLPRQMPVYEVPLPIRLRSGAAAVGLRVHSVDMVMPTLSLSEAQTMSTVSNEDAGPGGPSLTERSERCSDRSTPGRLSNRQSAYSTEPPHRQMSPAGISGGADCAVRRPAEASDMRAQAGQDACPDMCRRSSSERSPIEQRV